MSFHQWKRRLWGPDYPFFNGPPFIDPGTGQPIWPGQPSVQKPFEGVDDDGPHTGNPVTITFTGPSTGPLSAALFLQAGNGFWSGAYADIPAAATAIDIAAVLVADFNARNWDWWQTATASAGAATFTSTASGDARVWAVYGPPVVRATPASPTPVPDPDPLPDFVEGPFTVETSTFFLQRERGLWYVWFDTDPDTDPDVRIALNPFLNDPANAAFAPTVSAKAEELGYTP